MHLAPSNNAFEYNQLIVLRPTLQLQLICRSKIISQNEKALDILQFQFLQGNSHPPRGEFGTLQPFTKIMFIP